MLQKMEANLKLLICDTFAIQSRRFTSLLSQWNVKGSTAPLVKKAGGCSCPLCPPVRHPWLQPKNNERQKKRAEQNKSKRPKSLIFGTIKHSKKITFGSYAAADYVFKSFQMRECKKVTVSHHCFQYAGVPERGGQGEQLAPLPPFCPPSRN